MTPSVATIRLSPSAGPDRWKAANEAARTSTGEVLLFLPGDVEPASDLDPRIAGACPSGSTRVLLGEVSPAARSHPLAQVRRCRGKDTPATVASDYAGQIMAMPATLFRQSGGFAEDLGWGTEVDLAFRVGALGAEPHRLEGPAGQEVRPLSAAAAVRERVAAGAGSVELYRRTPALLPQLELGAFHSAGPPGLALRRRLLALGGPAVPPSLGRLLLSRSSRERWLRFQFEYHYWRGVRQTLRGPEWDGLLRPPVILMYHAVGAPGEPAGRYIVPLARFRRQMRWLALRGYRVLALEELLECRRAGRPAPPRAVIITFDDGYADNGKLAAPVLRSHRFPATVFLVSGSVGGRNGWDSEGELVGRAMLTRQELSALADAGMHVGAHSRTHPRLPALPDGQVLEELRGSRLDLEDSLGRPVRTFAYPFGALDDRVVAAVGAAGFEAACCSRSGRNDPVVPAMRLRRVEVCGTDSLLRFALAVHRGWTRRRGR